MTGAIIIITVCYYLISIGLSMGLEAANLYVPWAGLFIPPLLAGFFGALQYIRTERALLRIGDRLICAAKGCFVIILAPVLFSLVIIAAGSLGAGLGGILALPGIAALLTAGGLIQTLMFMIYAVPLIYIGLTVGQWVKSGRISW